MLTKILVVGLISLLSLGAVGCDNASDNNTEENKTQSVEEIKSEVNDAYDILMDEIGLNERNNQFDEDGIGYIVKKDYDTKSVSFNMYVSDKFYDEVSKDRVGYKQEWIKDIIMSNIEMTATVDKILDKKNNDTEFVCNLFYVRDEKTPFAIIKHSHIIKDELYNVTDKDIKAFKETKKETNKETKKETNKETKKETNKETKKETNKETKVKTGQCYDCGEYYPVNEMTFDGRSYHCGCDAGYCDNCGTHILHANKCPYPEIAMHQVDGLKLCTNCYNTYIADQNKIKENKRKEAEEPYDPNNDPTPEQEQQEEETKRLEEMYGPYANEPLE